MAPLVGLEPGNAGIIEGGEHPKAAGGLVPDSADSPIGSHKSSLASSSRVGPGNPCFVHSVVGIWSEAAFYVECGIWGGIFLVRSRGAGFYLRLLNPTSAFRDSHMLFIGPLPFVTFGAR